MSKYDMNLLQDHINSLMVRIKADPKLPFTCPHANCDKNFTHQSSLSLHLQSHTGKKQFPCSFCDK